jgi:Glycosyl Hydrolase Family 88
VYWMKFLLMKNIAPTISMISWPWVKLSKIANVLMVFGM